MRTVPTFMTSRQHCIFGGNTGKWVKNLKKQAFENSGLCESNKMNLSSENSFDILKCLPKIKNFVYFRNLFGVLVDEIDTTIRFCSPSLQSSQLELAPHRSFFHHTICPGFYPPATWRATHTRSYLLSASCYRHCKQIPIP